MGFNACYGTQDCVGVSDNAYKCHRNDLSVKQEKLGEGFKKVPALLK